LAQYYVGLQIADGASISSLLACFMPKIMVLFTSMTFIHTEIILKLHDKKEQDLEKVQNAYIRFIRGQFKIKVDEVNDVPDSD